MRGRSAGVAMRIMSSLATNSLSFICRSPIGITLRGSRRHRGCPSAVLSSSLLVCLGESMAELLRAPAQEVRTPVADSRRWNLFEPRDGDIVIGTFAKCGTTWTQRIVDLLVFQSPDVRPFG